MATRSEMTTRAERRSHGRACRNRIRRVDQAKWDPRRRNFNVIDLLLESQRGRIPELLPIKWAHMKASPFGFFRGAVPVMAADLAPLPRTGLTAQLCGDAHVQNLGAFEAPDGRLIFDINDFDETIIGPWEWDVKRMSASLVLAGREAGNSDKDCRNAVLAFVRNYRVCMNRFAEMPFIDLARYQIYRDIDCLRTVLRKAERTTPLHNLERLTYQRGGRHIFHDRKPMQFHVSQREENAAKASLPAYTKTLLPERARFFRHYRVEDVCFRVVGTGSVGLRDYVLLMFGGATSDPLFIQIKEEPRSAYAPYLPRSPVPAHQGQRTAEGGRAMQMQSDIFLGWTSIAGRDYLVRQLKDHKAGIGPGDLKGVGLVQYAEMCGELLSKGHARSGDPCTIAGYLGNNDRFDIAMALFGATYANQTTKDWEAMKRAINHGKLNAAAGA
ncbi:MAG TPA: DUF2252 domain-containing protein [Terriglobales bacterium]|nr:DUF2252 domain-containing protein [Terriglobales bacterium]